MQNVIKLCYLHANYTDTVHRLLNVWNVLWVRTRIGDLHAKCIENREHAYMPHVTCTD